MNYVEGVEVIFEVKDSYNGLAVVAWSNSAEWPVGSFYGESTLVGFDVGTFALATDWRNYWFACWERLYLVRHSRGVRVDLSELTRQIDQLSDFSELASDELYTNTLAPLLVTLEALQYELKKCGHVMVTNIGE